MRLPNNYCTPRFLKTTLQMEQKHVIPADFDVERDKPDFCSFVVSNDDANPIRQHFFELLSRYKKVDSGGRFMNNIGGPVDDKTAFDARHRFAITFENSATSGYTTEKIVDAFAARCIPIYWGDPEITRIFNPKAFIHVRDFESLEKVVDTVIAIDNDKEAYVAMLREPALLDNAFCYENVYRKVVAKLDSIIDQPIITAYRMNRDFWGKKYIEREKRLIVHSKKDWKILILERIRAKL